MATALSIFGVAFAAFCVWLTVRIVNRRERWAKLTALVLVVVFVVYPLSAGPAAWLAFNILPDKGVVIVEIVYCPLSFAAGTTEPTETALDWYLGLWFDRARLR